MNKEHLISVILPTYNRDEFIEEAIDSVLNQRLPAGTSLEVIIIDDGSTDNTERIITKKYAKKVKYKKIEHTGKPAASRNAGLAEASGALIAFQDSDDVWAEDKLIKSLPAFDDKEIIGVYGNAGYIDASGKEIPDKNAIAPGRSFEGDIFYYLTSRNKPSFPTPTIILRKNIIDKVGLFNENLIIATDTEYWIRYSTQGNFKYIDDVLCYVRRHVNNISSVPSEGGAKALYKHEVNRINMYEQIIATGLLSKDQKAALHARIIELHFYVSEISAKLGDERSALFQNESGYTYRQALKKYYGRLPRQVTSIGLVSWIKRSVSSRFPRFYAKAVRMYKSIRKR